MSICIFTSSMEDPLHPSMAGEEGGAAVENEGGVGSIRAVALVRQPPGCADYFCSGVLASAAGFVAAAGFIAAAGLGDQNAGSPAISCGEG
jgi:hypothetical protein